MQHAKALAILEVKDGVIERLEQEVYAAEAEVGHYEKGAELAEARAAAACATESAIAALQHDTICEGDVYARQDCELLAKMAAQAERRAQDAAVEIAELREQSSEAEHSVERLSVEMLNGGSAMPTTLQTLSSEASRQFLCHLKRCPAHSSASGPILVNLHRFLACVNEPFGCKGVS